MQIQKTFISLALVMLFVLSGCGLIGGSSPVTLNDIPVYPGATELKQGDSRIAETLARNSQQSTALSQASGVGGKTEQKGFSLPKDASWEALKKFYDDKLKSSGWGDAGGGMASNILIQVNAQNVAANARGLSTNAFVDRKDAEGHKLADFCDQCPVEHLGDVRLLVCQ